VKWTAAIGFLSITASVAPLTRAPFTADYQTNIISAVTSNWSGSYIVGSNTFADVLLIENSGVLSNENGFLGYEVGSSSNSAVVRDSGSVWSNRASLSVGGSGSDNSLVISNGAEVIVVGGSSSVGFGTGSSNNNVLITNSGSVWKSGVEPFIGDSGSGNSLVIGAGAQVIGVRGAVGFRSNRSHNYVLVTDAGSTWSTSGGFAVGGRFYRIRSAP
jgi:T5SS/PEP-CTERM-associated repeat protein